MRLLGSRFSDRRIRLLPYLRMISGTTMSMMKGCLFAAHMTAIPAAEAAVPMAGQTKKTRRSPPRSLRGRYDQVCGAAYENRRSLSRPMM
jgi:hypothetical protein